MNDQPDDAAGASATVPVRWCVIGFAGDSAAEVDAAVDAVELDADAAEIRTVRMASEDLPPFVATHEAASAKTGSTPVRWVWSDTPYWYPKLLAANVTVNRCHDLRLCHAILKNSSLVSADNRALLNDASSWDSPSLSREPAPEQEATLFDVDVPSPGAVDEIPNSVEAALEEFGRQRAANVGSVASSRLTLLLAAESAGALAAVDMETAGVPWDEAVHDRILTELLGPRPAPGMKPERMLEVADEVRGKLEAPEANLDSPPKLLRALRRAGIEVTSTSRWELEEHDHPAVEPLLRYKKLSRLLTANGWSWLDEWVQDGRYHPVYVPGGVVTGRWAANGGGALQLPRNLRPALKADPGWLLVSADVAQLEPRVLAAMSGDRAMASAGREKDLYSGIVDRGVVKTREEAKYAVLGAMYGGTTGISGRLVPQLRRSFPDAMKLVDDSAAVGEIGGTVMTWLGRTSPPPDPVWHRIQDRAGLPEATAHDEERARRVARSFGRFTRNFVVQGSAAEWAMAWISILRHELARMGPAAQTTAVPKDQARPRARTSPPLFTDRPHLVFFLHDEVIVHTPADQAEAAAEAVQSAAVAAGKLLFGDAPVDFPLDVKIAETAEK